MLPTKLSVLGVLRKVQHYLLYRYVLSCEFSLDPKLLGHMTLTMPGLDPEDRYACLDMLPISWESLTAATNRCQCAILLEIWSSGGLLQTGMAIPEGSVLTISAPGGSVHAHVSYCEQDDYGFLVHVAVDSPEDWFPAAYQPAYLATDAVHAG